MTTIADERPINYIKIPALNNAVLLSYLELNSYTDWIKHILSVLDTYKN